MTAATGVAAIRAPNEALFPPAGERERIDDYLTRELLMAQRPIAAGPATPTLSMDAFRRELAGFDFAVPRPPRAVLDWSIPMLEHGVVHLTHPRYFGLFNPCPSFPAQCADRIAGSFNPQVASSATSPAAVALEAHVIRMVGQRAGFPAGSGGHFTSGGSEANFTALLCALTRAHPGFAADGARALPGPPVFYTSRECHRSWVKIAHQAGIGRTAARLVATDGSGRMSIAALAAAIEEDTGERPGAGADRRLGGHHQRRNDRSLARVRGSGPAPRPLVHVDAAWGGAAIASQRLRGVLAGLERPSSATIEYTSGSRRPWAADVLLARDEVPGHVNVAARATCLARAIGQSSS